MLTGQPPFRAKGRAALAKQITGGGKLKVPPYLSPEASSLLRALLQREPHKRLGFGATGSDDVMAHAFFAPLDWAALLRSELPSPFVPTLRAHDSVENFDKIWTDLEPEDSPCGTPRRPVTAPTAAGGGGGGGGGGAGGGERAATAGANGTGAGKKKKGGGGTPASSGTATPKLPPASAAKAAPSAKKRIPSKTPSPAPPGGSSSKAASSKAASNAAAGSDEEERGEEDGRDDEDGDEDDDDGDDGDSEEQLGEPYGEEAEALFRGFSYCAPSSLPGLVEKLQSAMMLRGKGGGDGGGGEGGSSSGGGGA